jgi:hypothetical protein
MKIDEVNDMIYYLAEKYGFNPLKYKINLLTGIVTPKDLDYQTGSELMGEEPSEVETVESHMGREPKPVMTVVERPVEEHPRRVVEIEDSVDGIRTYRILADEMKAEYMAADKGGRELDELVDTGEILKQLDDWINRNRLTYLDARKMVSSLGLKKKIREVAPGSSEVMDSALLNEFDGWIRRRGLNYFEVRMMIARLGQEEEQARMEKTIAR